MRPLNLIRTNNIKCGENFRITTNTDQLVHSDISSLETREIPVSKTRIKKNRTKLDTQY